MAGTGDTTKKVPPGQEVLPIPAGFPPPMGDVDSQRVTVIDPGRPRSSSSAGSGELLPPFETRAAPLEPEPPRPALPGFELLRELARGGMGVVYEAWSQALGQTVALKIVLPELLVDVETVQRVEREVAAQARLRHPNIVKVLDTGRMNGCPWLAMELIPGESLEKRIARQGPLSQPLAAAWARALAEALAHAHALGVLHRDLKPANVLLGPDQHPRLTDFGLARLQDDQRRLTMTGVILGSPAYMAPEQASGDPRQVGPATDVFGLGAILYEMLTGRAPHPGTSQIEVLEAVITRDPDPPSALRPDLDPALEAICLRCLAREPSARWGSMDELARALEAWGVTAARRMAPRPAVSPALAAAGVAALASALLAVAALVGALPGSGPAVPGPPTTVQPPAPPPPPPPDPRAALRETLAQAPTCAVLLRAAEQAGQAGLAPASDLSALDPSGRSRLLFAFHLQQATSDLEQLAQLTPPMARLRAEGIEPWSGMARALELATRIEQGATSAARRALDGLTAGEAAAWVALLRGPLSMYDLSLGEARLDMARADLERARSLDPTLWLASVMQARLEVLSGREPEARRLLEPLVADPATGPPLALCLQANLLSSEGALDEAWDLVQAALERAPGLQDGLLTQAEIQLKRRELHGALAALDDLRRRGAPEHMLYAIECDRARALLMMDDWEAAARLYQELFGRSRDVDQRVVDGWSRAMLELGQGEAALKQVQALALKSPGVGLERTIQRLRMEVETRRGWAVPPDASDDELVALMQARWDQSQWGAAVAVMDRIIAGNPLDLRRALIDRAWARLNNRQAGAAIRDLRRAEGLRGGLAVADQEALAKALGIVGRYSEAREVVQRLLSLPLDPEQRARARLSLGRLQVYLGDLPAAEEALRTIEAERLSEMELTELALVRALLRKAQSRWTDALAELDRARSDLVGDPGAVTRLRAYLEKKAKGAR